MSRVRDLVARWQASFAGRVWERYGRARGSVLAGGIAYFALFSIFPALALGFTVLGFVVEDDSALLAEVVRYVNDSFGSTVIRTTAEGPGIVSLDTLVQREALTVGAVAGLVVLVFTGLGWVDAIRQGVSAVFGRATDGNPVLGRVRDLAVLALVGVLALASVLGGLVVTAATSTVLGWLDLSGGWVTALVRVLTAGVVLLVDAGLLLVMVRGLSGVRLPFDVLWRGALAGAVGLGLLKLSGGLLLGRLSDNRFLATFSVIVGLLVWLDLVARLTLLTASWVATTAADRGVLDAALADAEGVAEPEPATAALASGRPRAVVAAARTRADVVARTPTYGVRAADRTTLAAGVVLGFAGAAVLRVARGAARAVVDAVRD